MRKNFSAGVLVTLGCCGPRGSPFSQASTCRAQSQIELFRQLGLCFTLPMCYSAMVWQAYEEYIRTMGAPPNYAQIEELPARRLTDKSIRIARGFERNFDSPKSPQERRIKDLIDQHRAVTITKLEQDLFAQKKRLADAQRKLKVKETKAAMEDQRIAPAKIEASLEKLSLLKGTQPHADDNRIFPLTYVPIILVRGGERVVRLAHYHLRQRGKPASIDRQFPGLYNAFGAFLIVSS